MTKLNATGSVTDWVSYTPTILDGITTPSVVGKYRIVGDSIECSLYCTVQEVTSAIHVGIPTGFTIDTSKVSNTGAAQVLGTAQFSTSNGSNYLDGTVIYYQATSVQFISNGGSGNGWDTTRPVDWVANDKFSCRFTVPIVGLSSNVSVGQAATIEYAYNTGASTTSDDTTSFGYGTSGTSIVAFTNQVGRRVRFQNAIQPTDLLFLEYLYTGETIWKTVDCFDVQHGIVPLQVQGTIRYGLGFASTIGIPATDCDVYFGQYMYASSATYGAAGVAWNTSYKWRVKKVSSGAQPSLPISARAITGDISGVAVPSGFLGEYRESLGSSTSLTSATYSDGGAAGILLQPGIYDLQAYSYFSPSATTVVTTTEVYVGTATGNSNTGRDPSRNLARLQSPAGFTPANDWTMSSPLMRVNVTVATTYYAKSISFFSASTLSVTNALFVRRIA
jgi:hypothetical protein